MFSSSAASCDLNPLVALRNCARTLPARGASWESFLGPKNTKPKKPRKSISDMVMRALFLFLFRRSLGFLFHRGFEAAQAFS